MTKIHRILLSNDDGIHARGLEVLEQVARAAFPEVEIWICAPEAEQSAVSHALTLRRGLFLCKYGERRYSVNGTPTDCVIVGVSKLFDGHRPDLVLSGVNHGSNAGCDFTYSGTAAVAEEATLMGIPAIALSLDSRKDAPFLWETVLAHAPRLLPKITRAGIERETFVNINFPAVVPDKVTGMHVAPQWHGRRHGLDRIHACVDGEDGAGKPCLWIDNHHLAGCSYPEDSDVSLLKKGGIVVTPVRVNPTHHDAINHYRAHLAAD